MGPNIAPAISPSLTSFLEPTPPRFDPAATHLIGVLRGEGVGPEVIAVALDLGQRAAQLHGESSESVIRYQQIRSRADHSYLDPGVLCPGEQDDELLLRLGAGEIVGGAAGADRGQAS